MNSFQNVAKTTIAGALVAAALLAAVVIFSNVNAQEGNGFTVSPPSLPIEVNPGEKQEITINVTNVTSDDIEVKVDINNFTASAEDETGLPTVIVDNTQETGFSLREYVTPISNFNLGPNEDKEVKVTINVPANAEPGGHYGVVRFTRDFNKESVEREVSVSASVGTLILLNVSGDVVEDLDVIDFGVGIDGEFKNFFTNLDDPIKLYGRIENNGNTHSQPFGKVVVKNIFGRKVGSYEFNEERGYTLPDSIRRYETELEDKNYFGMYTAEGSISYGDGGGEIESVSDRFFVFPLIQTLIALGVVILVVVVLRAVFVAGRRR